MYAHAQVIQLFDKKKLAVVLTELWSLSGHVFEIRKWPGLLRHVITYYWYMLLLITGTCYYLLSITGFGACRPSKIRNPWHLGIGGVTSRGNDNPEHKVMFSDFQEVNIHNNTTELAKVSFRCLFS
jgi:hypothetical protein